jgi:predicted nucleotidyltransferase component of viral defense system
MSLDIIHERLKIYDIKTKQAEVNAIKEICQEIALAGLARGGFFKQAQFQGGTCLRIIHGLKRFSEDLDFILNTPNADFNWAPFLAAITEEFVAFGLTLSVNDRSSAEGTIKKAFLKEGSFGKVLKLQHKINRSDKQNILIKLEIDTNPPFGSVAESQFLEYPYPFSIITQNLSSLFAGKLHALLCRTYTKGRDWFDFVWYIQNHASVNYTLLENALLQCGPYQNQTIQMSRAWLVSALESKVQKIDWGAVMGDVQKFLPSYLVHSTNYWSTELFLSLIHKLP